MQQLGAFLKAEREKKGIRLSDISSVTKIPVHNLKLIEEGKWSALPAKPFVKGFLTAYAKYLGLNGAQVYQKYLEETAPVAEAQDTSSTQTEPPQTTPREINSAPKFLQLKPILFSIGGVLFLMGSIWLIQIGKQNTENPMVSPITSNSVVPIETPPQETTPPVSERVRELANAPEQPNTSINANPPEALVPEVPGHELEVNPKELTWVKVVIDEAPPVNLRLNPEEKTKFRAKEKIKLVLGNATGAEVVYNGTKTDGKIQSGTIRYYIFPAGSKFPQDKARQISAESAAPSQEPSITDESNQESNKE